MRPSFRLPAEVTARARRDRRDDLLAGPSGDPDAYLAADPSADPAGGQPVDHSADLAACRLGDPLADPAVDRPADLPDGCRPAPSP